MVLSLIHIYDNLISHAGLLSARTVLGILARDDGSAL